MIQHLTAPTLHLPMDNKLQVYKFIQLIMVKKELTT